MRAELTKDGGSESWRISSKTQPLLMILTTVAAVLAIQSVTVLITGKPSWVLFGLIVGNLVCAVWMLIVCAELIAPVTFTLDADGLTHSRLLTQSKYPWDEISAAKMVPAGGSLSDAPQDEDRGRLGVGLVRKAQSKAAPRSGLGAASGKVPVKPAEEEPPMVVLIGASRDQAEKIMEIVESINGFQARLHNKTPERWRRAPQAQQQQQFRKRPNITMPA